MNIIDFYKKLSKVLEDYREGNITHTRAQSTIEDLKRASLEFDLGVVISPHVLNMDNLINYDDERSFEEDSYESSYEDD